MAYTFVINKMGHIQQACPLTAITPHAKKWNKITLAVALIGDFRKSQVPQVQYDAAVELVTELCRGLLINDIENVRGHDELPGGSTDDAKRCPGKHLDMRVFRAAVREMIQNRATSRLLTLGVALS
jgi:N-acetyl-anhydromuramyl-L-alanine amidase AmpD